MTKRFTALAVATALLLGITLAATASPAAAAYEDCPVGQSCMWTEQFGKGVIFTIAFSSYQPVGSCHNLTGVMPVNVESARAGFGGAYSLEFYTNWNCINSANSKRWKMHAGTIESWAWGGYKSNSARSWKIIVYA